jgi:Zn-dependent alcohol dehydrogenase
MPLKTDAGGGIITTVTDEALLAHFLAVNRERRSSAAGNVSGIVGASPIGTQLTSDAFQLITVGGQVRGAIEAESIPKMFIPKLLDL